VKLNDGNLISLMDMLVGNGAKDPAGILAQMEAHDDDFNVTGITDGEASTVGLREAVNEPMMSLMGAMMSDLRSTDPNDGRKRLNPGTAATAIRNRDAVFNRAMSAKMRGVPPENPFVDASGMLVMKRRTKGEPAPHNEKAIKEKIASYFDEIDGN
jgi:hypothetical protein